MFVLIFIITYCNIKKRTSAKGGKKMDSKFTIKIDDRELSFDKKVKIIDLIEGNVHDYIYAKVNNRLRELTYELYYNAEVKLLKKSDYEAVKAYETSLRYIVAMACSRVFPNLEIKYSYSISRSIFLTFSSLSSKKENFQITHELVQKLKDAIDDIVAHDYPFKRKVVSNDEATKIYKKLGFDDKISILKYRPEKTVHFYECNGYMNYIIYPVWIVLSFFFSFQSDNHASEGLFSLTVGGYILVVLQSVVNDTSLVRIHRL